MEANLFSKNPSAVKPFRVSLLAALVSLCSAGAYAQDDAALQAAEEAGALEEVIVTGIRNSLQSAQNQKRAADNLIEVIIAEDIGKLPDQNLAEVLENIPGVQITREAGVGEGVQIRGVLQNRLLINGVNTVGSGDERQGIDFEDVPSAIIAAVDVIKAPEAKTIEGSAGGTINLRTIRPLDLKETLGAIRVQGEDSSLSTDGGLSPRISGSWGDNWTTDAGDFGVVLTGSYTEQKVNAFRPRADRDNLISTTSGVASAQSFNFLPIQFFVQDYDSYEYETKNFSGSFEWAPNDNLKLYLDVVLNDQERFQESTRVQASGVSALNDVSVPATFETINLGSLGGQSLGSIQAAQTGVVGVDLTNDDDDPNLRTSTDTGSRITENEIFRLGGDWQKGKWSGRVEVSLSDSDTSNPEFSTTLNFINPNAPVDPGGANDNSTPFQYDLTGGSLAFGIATAAQDPTAPSTAQLLNPANYVLRDVNFEQDEVENSEDVFLTDFSYELDWKAITSVDFGYRYSSNSSVRDQIRSNIGLRQAADSPTGNLFASVITAGPTNFNAADGRSLYVRDFLVVDPELGNSNPNAVAAVLNDAITAHGGSTPITQPTSRATSFFDIEEKTSALYAQANFEHGIFRGNFGLRYVSTDVDSTGNRVTEVGGATQLNPTTTSSSYSFILPRLNVAANVREDVVVRASWTKDVVLPDFDQLSTSFAFDTSPNEEVEIGNPGLEPLEVESFDLAAEWYFAPASMVSLGYFRKERTNSAVDELESAFEDPVTGFRDLTDPCEQGGIFNPIADPNVFAPTGTPVGVCVSTARQVNGSGKQTQEGWELAVQYDLAQYENKLGWASGFGVHANYTIQDFEGGDDFLGPTSRAENIFDAQGVTNVQYRQIPLDLSETSYNFTLYYEKYGLSARARYTWREAYRSEDFGSTNSRPWGFPVVQEDRGQLNASVNYDVTENLKVGVEAVNLTESEVEQSCVNEGALLCFQGLTDRRITIGASYRF